MRVFRKRNIRIIGADAGLTDKEIPDPRDVNNTPINKSFLEDSLFRMSINPELKIVKPAATGMSLELTCDMPTQIGNDEIIPK
jgi:hypothetical protein